MDVSLDCNEHVNMWIGNNDLEELEGYVARCSELGVAGASDSPSDKFVNLKEATELYVGNDMLIVDLIRIKPFFRSSLDSTGMES